MGRFLAWIFDFSSVALLGLALLFSSVLFAQSSGEIQLNPLDDPNLAMPDRRAPNHSFDMTLVDSIETLNDVNDIGDLESSESESWDETQVQSRAFSSSSP